MRAEFKKIIFTTPVIPISWIGSKRLNGSNGQNLNPGDQHCDFGFPANINRKRHDCWRMFATGTLLQQLAPTTERILRALIAQCPYKFSSFLDLGNGSSRFRLYARDFRLFRFFFSRSACFSKVPPPENLQSWVKYHGKSESFGKEFRWTKFNAVERVTY